MEQFFSKQSQNSKDLTMQNSTKIQKQKSHPNSSLCLGCRTFFEEMESLPLECLTVQYKNFAIPIVENKNKWNLLKTIVSFLNTKGGTIYIGVQDSNCQVIGKQIAKKARDQFKLYFFQIVERIQPQVDLTQKEQITVQFIPVLKNNVFSGKYVIKIVIKQGEPTQTYCFVQKIQWTLEGRKEIQTQSQNFEVVYAFVRHNMGGAKQIKGIKLIEQATKRARNPAPMYLTFHEECNPEPPQLEVQIKKIGFKNLGKREQRRRFQRLCSEQLGNLNAEFQIVYDTELKAVIIQLPTEDEFNRINSFIKANLSTLNESQDSVSFVEKGNILDVHFYQNTVNKNEQEKVNPKEQPQIIDEKMAEQFIEKKIQYKKREKPILKEVKERESETENEQEASSLTFTHINPQTRDKLLNYLAVSISKKIHLLSQTYENTIELYFQCKQDQRTYGNICMQLNHLRALQCFGFNNQIRIGFNTGHLHILNYDKNKERKLLNSLKSIMAKDLKEVQVLKRGNRYIVDCRMATTGLACIWLDKLLINKQIKQFRIPGAQIGKSPKMKVLIHCSEINS